MRDFRRERRDDRADFNREQRQDRQQFRGERRDDRQALRDGRVTPEQFRQDRRDDVRDFRADRRDDRRDFRRDRADDRRDLARDLRRDDPRARDRWRDADRLRQWNRSDIDWRDQARRDGQFADRSGWNRDWRRDDRYDWNGWRARNRDSYRLPRYYAPPGWGYGYRRFSVGVSLNAALWGSSYWIGDPWEYRLPPAYGPYRWVRYYDDALLVDVRDGNVVDVVYDIFW